MSKLFQVSLCTVYIYIYICLAVGSAFAETVVTTGGVVGAKADVNAYNAYLAQGKDVTTTGTVTDTATKKGYIGTGQGTTTQHYNLASGASAKIVLEPGIGSLGLLGSTTSGSEGKVWKEGYRASGVKVWSHVGIGWFNADGTPATINGRWFGSHGTEASANVPGGTDLGLPENQTAYYKNPGVAYKSTGVMGSTNAAMSFVSTSWNQGSEGIYMNNANNGSASGRGSSWGDLANFRNAALATSGQNLDTAKFTWVSIDFSEVTNSGNGQTRFDSARIAQFDISNSDPGAARDSANTKALRYAAGTDTVLNGVDTIAAGTIAYFKINEIGVQNFGLFGQVDMVTGGNALTGNTSNWKPIKLNFLSVTETLASSTSTVTGDVVYAADAAQVAQLGALKTAAESATAAVDTANTAVADAATALTGANDAVLVAADAYVAAAAEYNTAVEAFNVAKAVVDAYNDGEFVSYAEALAAYQAGEAALADAQAAAATATAAFAAAETAYNTATAAATAALNAYNNAVAAAGVAASAKASADSAYDAYLAYGAERQQGIDNSFDTITWSISENGLFSGAYNEFLADSVSEYDFSVALNEAPTATPEPATLLILGLGLAGLGLARRRK